MTDIIHDTRDVPLSQRLALRHKNRTTAKTQKIQFINLQRKTFNCPIWHTSKTYINRPKDCKGRCWSLISEADNPQTTCHYFLPGPRLPSQHQSFTVLGRYQFILLEQRLVCEQLA